MFVYFSLFLFVFVCLFVCLLCSCESRTDRREPVHLGKTPSAPLSATAERLLEEYGLRYGVVCACVCVCVCVCVCGVLVSMLT